jgi:homoserine kinase
LIASLKTVLQIWKKCRVDGLNDEPGHAAYMKQKSVTIKIPCSTSNLGSGFDTLGLALALYNTVRVVRSDSTGVSLNLPGPAQQRESVLPMLIAAAGLFFERSGQQPFGIEVDLAGQVPAGRGLGASATARLGIIAALNHLTDNPLDSQQVLEVVTLLEHHPDNASPCLFGGFTVSGIIGKIVRCLSFPVSEKLSFITLIPKFEINTQAARKLVPESFTKADTMHSLNRAALISAAFSSGNYDALKGLFDDRVHQPYREKLIPELSAVIAAGEQAGAIGGWLSGSGSAIMCMALGNRDDIASAMQSKLPDSTLLILKADNAGMKVLNE